MSLVLQRDPGELRVRVRVLDGQPAAGQHADAVPAVPGRAQPLGGDASAPRARTPRAAHRSRSSRTSGVVSRSVAVAYWKPQRPLSQFHSSLTAGSSPASRRSTLPRRWSVRWAQPAEQCSQTLGRGDQVERAGPEPVLGAGQRADRADLHGVAGEVGVERDVARVALLAVRVVPVDVDLLGGRPVHQVDELVAGDLLGEPGAALAEHAPLAVQQHLAGDRRSASGTRACARGSGESVRPVDIAWFCSGHSPPLSHIGQSSGWLISSSSMIPSCAFLATGEVSWVRTTMPSATVWVQEATGLRWPSTSTRHCRQAPAGASSGWSQNRGISMPICSATRISSVALGRGHLDAVDGERDRVGLLGYVASSVRSYQLLRPTASARCGPRCSPGSPA